MPFAKHLDVMVVDDTFTSRALTCGSLDELGITYRPATRVAATKIQYASAGNRSEAP